MESKNGLKDKWSNFFNVLLDPWVIIMLIATVVFIHYSIQTDDKKLLAILTVIISVFSGLLGGIVANRWAQLTELKVLVARGKSAIRSLKLILLNITNIERRTGLYINCIDDENKDYKLIKSNFEEIIEKCNILEEEIISSIENWTDIIPEVENLKTQIGLISEMKLHQIQLNEDISKLQKEIVDTKEEGSKNNEALQKQIIEKEKDLTNTKSKLREAERNINTSVLSGLTSSKVYDATGRLAFNDFLNHTRCKGCGQYFFGVTTDNRCDSCKSKTPLFRL
jgi:hypothetical protein